MKHRVKVQYTVEVEAKSQRSAIIEASYSIPDGTTNVQMESWTPKEQIPNLPLNDRSAANPNPPIPNAAVGEALDQADGHANEPASPKPPPAPAHPLAPPAPPARTPDGKCPNCQHLCSVHSMEMGTCFARIPRDSNVKYDMAVGLTYEQQQAIGEEWDYCPCGSVLESSPPVPVPARIDTEPPTSDDEGDNINF